MWPTHQCGCRNCLLTKSNKTSEFRFVRAGLAGLPCFNLIYSFHTKARNSVKLQHTSLRLKLTRTSSRAFLWCKKSSFFFRFKLRSSVSFSLSLSKLSFHLDGKMSGSRGILGRFRGWEKKVHFFLSFSVLCFSKHVELGYGDFSSA